MPLSLVPTWIAGGFGVARQLLQGIGMIKRQVSKKPVLVLDLKHLAVVLGGVNTIACLKDPNTIECLKSGTP